MMKLNSNGIALWADGELLVIRGLGCLLISTCFECNTQINVGILTL